MYVKRLSTRFNPLDVGGIREEEEKEMKDAISEKRKVMSKYIAMDKSATVLPSMKEISYFSFCKILNSET